MLTKGVYIAGSKMNAGKTTLSLGLTSYFNSTLENGSAFIKPIGQKTMTVEGMNISDDSYLINTVLGLDSSISDTTPFTAGSGMAEQFIREGKSAELKRSIKRSYKNLSKTSDLVVIEGTGHPGVGSVFGMCNATVASFLSAPVILILDGGIGSTIDKFTLDASLFRNMNVPILGVVINRIRLEKMEKVKRYLSIWFSENDIPVFGYIPFVSDFARPSLGMINIELAAETVVSSEKGISVRDYLTGFGNVDEIYRNVSNAPGRALLLSSSRQEVIDAIIARKMSGKLHAGPGALILCGDGGEYAEHVDKACGMLDIPLFRTSKSAEESAFKLSTRIFKVEPGDSDKIKEIVSTITEHVDMDAILNALNTHYGGTGEKVSLISKAGRWLKDMIGLKDNGDRRMKNEK